MAREPLDKLELFHLLDLEFAEIICFDVIGDENTDISALERLRTLMLLFEFRWQRPIAWRLVNEFMSKNGIGITVSQYQREKRKLRPKLRGLWDSYRLHGEGILPLLTRYR
jgi:hypothetical protein